MATRARFIADLLERTVSTYVQAFLGILLGDSTHVLNIGSLHAAAVAGLPAALAVIKGALAGSLTQSHTAGFLGADAPAILAPLETDARTLVRDVEQGAPPMLREAIGDVQTALYHPAPVAVPPQPTAAPAAAMQPPVAPVLPTSNPVPPMQS